MQVIKRQSLIDAAISRGKLIGWKWTNKNVVEFIRGHEYFEIDDTTKQIKEEIEYVDEY